MKYPWSFEKACVYVEPTTDYQEIWLITPVGSIYEVEYLGRCSGPIASTPSFSGRKLPDRRLPSCEGNDSTCLVGPTQTKVAVRELWL